MNVFLSAKLHGLRVTGTSLDYHGSVTISEDIMASAGIRPYEQVDVCNSNTGHRWTTYAIPTVVPRRFEVNGPGARLAEPGDPCVVLTWQHTATPAKPIVVMFDEHNEQADRFTYTVAP